MIPLIATLLEELIGSEAIGGAVAAGSSAGASGGASAAGASGSIGGNLGGLSGMLGRAFGMGGKALGSDAELGDAVRKISDLQQAIAQGQQAISANRKQSSDLSAKASEDERLYAFSFPSHKEHLAQLEKEHSALEKLNGQREREAGNLQMQVQATVDPPSASAQAARVGGAVAAIGSAVPYLARRLPGLDSAQQVAGAYGNVAAFGAGPTNTDVGAGIGAFAGQTAAIAGRAAMNPLSAMKAGPEMANQMSRLPMLLQEWGQGLVESKRHLSQYNATMASAFAQANLREITRGVESGSRTGGVTADLSDAMQDLYDVIQPIRDSVTIVLSRGVETGVRAITKGVQMIERIYQVVRPFSIVVQMAEAIMKRLGAGDAVKEFPFEDFARRAEAAAKNRFGRRR